MFSTYFLAMLLAHLLGDFVFQNDWLCDLKINPNVRRRLWAVSIHVLILFVINIIVFLFIINRIPWIVLFLTSAFHWLLDLAKSNIQSKKKICDSRSTSHIESVINDWSMSLFFGDQVLHLISIFIAVQALYRFDASHYVNFCYQFVSGTVSVSKSLTFVKKVLLALIYLSLATSVSNVVVKVFLRGLRWDIGVKTGRYIGGVERILTISIILVGAWQALTVIYGSKTAIRFEQAKESPDFAEYYILGTSLSALLAVIIAVAAKITFF